MSKIKKLTVWTIVLSFFILIGAGHGIIPIGIFEILFLTHGFKYVENNFSIIPTNSYEQSFLTASFYAFIGHIFLVLSLFMTKIKLNLILTAAGLIFLWTAYYCLSHNFFSEDLSQFSFYSGVPFLVVSIILVFKISRDIFIENRSN